MKVAIGPSGIRFVYCPGCHGAHQYDSRWQWNGNDQQPTFTPSYNSWHDGRPEDGIKSFRCHSFLTDGKFQFLSDCTHSLKGTTIDAPEFPPDYGIG